jgi:hypothetical protein
MSGKDEMTVKQIQQDVSKEATISERKVYRLIHRLHIKPLGQFDQRPQQYPADSAVKIREALGLPVTSNGTAHTPDDGKGGKLVPLSQLKTMRKAARKAA